MPNNPFKTNNFGAHKHLMDVATSGAHTHSIFNNGKHTHALSNEGAHSHGYSGNSNL